MECMKPMKRRTLALFIVLTLLHSACQEKAHKYEKTEDGIEVTLAAREDGVKRIKLQVVSDNIIHVIATPLDSFLNSPGLMVLPELKGNATWDVQETDKDVTVVTKNLRASVLLPSGEIVFTDTAGRVILQEQKGGGKTFVKSAHEAEPCYGIRQIFESTDDEAFYGLGGHQNGQVNYKGEDVELVQHNIVDVVPFLYSSKNYGILWDNYSISRFGDPREYEHLNTLDLFASDGSLGGLTASYYVNDKVIKKTTEPKIDYEYLETPQVDNFPKDVASKGKVVWEGAFSSEVTGVHKFLVYASGYFKVWLDGKLIMDKWRQGWNPWTNKFTVNCKPQEKHALKIEWKPDGGAYIAVKHLNPLPPAEQNKLSLSSEAADAINYYFVSGDNADEVIAGYRFLTGKAPVPPKWAMGFWQSRERYRDQKELLDVVKEYRKRRIPLDNIVLDWQYWEESQWGSHEFDASRFPDPKGMVRELHDELNANIMISVWPKFNKGTSHYEEMNKQGFLFTRNIDKKRKDWVGEGYESTFYDPFNPEAGDLFWKQIDRKLNKIGIDAWWLDATEPDIHSNLSIEERKINMSPTALGPGEKYFNAYSLMNSKSVYEGQRKSSPDKRVFILTRSAYGGQQRYGATTWSGDIVSRWSDFKDQIATGINFSLSGIPYWTMDIGGFAVERRFENATGETLAEWRELNTRWFQFGAFCPVFRSHGQFPFREIYNIAPEGTKEYESMVFYTKLRYRLMPYIYSLAGAGYHNDYTIMRGLVMDFPDDPNVVSIADQYMFGPAIMVAPVYTFRENSREVYLPSSCGWYDFYTGKFYKGGQTIKVEAPLERIPLFVKEGSIIPAGPEMQYVTEKLSDPLTLYVFPGKSGYFTLYEDENINYNYEQGKFSSIRINYNETARSVQVEKRKGDFTGMPATRKIEVVWVTEQSGGIGLTSPADKLASYSGAEITMDLNETK